MGPSAFDHIVRFSTIFIEKNSKFNIFTEIGNQKNALSHSWLDFDLIIDIDVVF